LKPVLAEFRVGSWLIQVYRDLTWRAVKRPLKGDDMNDTPLSKAMLLDGMYPGIVEKWSAKAAALESELSLLRRAVKQLGRLVSWMKPLLRPGALDPDVLELIKEQE
jgi:hypothetical protein